MRTYAGPESSEMLVRRYQDQARKQRTLARQLRVLRARLTSLGNGLRVLLADEHFTTLLRAENLDSVPTVLVNRRVTRDHTGGNHLENEPPGADRLLQSKRLSPTTRYELARMIPARQ